MGQSLTSCTMPPDTTQLPGDSIGQCYCLFAPGDFEHQCSPRAVSQHRSIRTYRGHLDLTDSSFKKQKFPFLTRLQSECNLRLAKIRNKPDWRETTNILFARAKTKIEAACGAGRKYNL